MCRFQLGERRVSEREGAGFSSAIRSLSEGNGAEFRVRALDATKRRGGRTLGSGRAVRRPREASRGKGNSRFIILIDGSRACHWGRDRVRVTVRSK